MKKEAFHRIVLIASLAFCAMAAPGFPQDQRVEINSSGAAVRDGLTIDPLVAGGEGWDRVDAKDGAAFGIQFGVLVTENMEVGFLWGRQASTLAGEGTTAMEFTSMPVYNYHAVFTYNFGESEGRSFSCDFRRT